MEPGSQQQELLYRLLKPDGTFEYAERLARSADAALDAVMSGAVCRGTALEGVPTSMWLWELGNVTELHDKTVPFSASGLHPLDAGNAKLVLDANWSLVVAPKATTQEELRAAMCCDTKELLELCSSCDGSSSEDAETLLFWVISPDGREVLSHVHEEADDQALIDAILQHRLCRHTALDGVPHVYWLCDMRAIQHLHDPAQPLSACVRPLNGARDAALALDDEWDVYAAPTALSQDALRAALLRATKRDFDELRPIP